MNENPYAIPESLEIPQDAVGDLLKELNSMADDSMGMEPEDRQVLREAADHIAKLEAENQRMVDETALEMLKDDVLRTAARRERELLSKLAAVENLERYAAIVAVGKGKLDYVEAVLDSDLQAALKGAG